MVMQRNAKSQESPFRRGDVTLLLIPCQVILFAKTDSRGIYIPFLKCSLRLQ